MQKTHLDVAQGLVLWPQFYAIFATFRRKKCLFIEQQCYNRILIKKLAAFLTKNANFFASFLRKHFKIHNIDPKVCRRTKSCNSKYFSWSDFFTSSDIFSTCFKRKKGLKRTTRGWRTGWPDEFVKKSPKIQPKSIFVKNTTCVRGSPKIYATSVVFKKLPNRKQPPHWCKLAKSGHPVGG
jgi:hypothetical protein